MKLAPLLHCARAGAIDAVAFESCVDRTTDWDSLLAAAEYHGLTPLLAAAVASVCPDKAPPHATEILQASRRDGTIRGLFYSSKLKALLAALQSEGIQALPLKGPVLAELLYSEPGLRTFADLDLLVHKRDVPGTLRILRHEGYEMGPHVARLPANVLQRLRNEVTLTDPSGVLVDLHWAIAPNDYPFCFDADILWSFLRPASLDGIEVPSVSLECLLLFLCVHGTKHSWTRLIWLADVARLVRLNLDWTKAFDLAKRVRCARPLLLGLLLAHDLLDVAIPDTLLERARADRAIVVGAEQVKSCLRRTVPERPTSVETTRFNARLAERPWDKVRHYAALLKAPTEAELEFLSLPPALFPLYYPVRFARLISKYALRFFGSRSE